MYASPYAPPETTTSGGLVVCSTSSVFSVSTEPKLSVSNFPNDGCLGLLEPLVFRRVQSPDNVVRSEQHRNPSQNVFFKNVHVDCVKQITNNDTAFGNKNVMACWTCIAPSMLSEKVKFTFVSHSKEHLLTKRVCCLADNQAIEGTSTETLNNKNKVVVVNVKLKQ